MPLQAGRGYMTARDDMVYFSRDWCPRSGNDFA